MIDSYCFLKISDCLYTYGIDAVCHRVAKMKQGGCAKTLAQPPSLDNNVFQLFRWKFQHFSESTV